MAINSYTIFWFVLALCVSTHTCARTVAQYDGGRISMEQQAKSFQPFTKDMAWARVQRVEDLWNTRDPKKVALAYAEDTVWRNRSEFIRVHAEVIALINRNCTKELDCPSKKALFIFFDD